MTDEAGAKESGGESPVVVAAAPEASTRRRVGLAALAIMLIHLLARLGGFLQKKVLATYFGTTVQADAATFMQRVFELIYYIPEELLTHTLLPVFTRARDDDGEAAAWRMASLTGTILSALLVAVSAFAWLRPDLLGGLIIGYPDPLDPDFQRQQETFDLAVGLIRIAFLGLFCTSIGSLTYVLLNAYKRFVTPALGDVAQKAGIILGTVVVCVGFGNVHPVGYAIGFILGGIFKLLVHVVSLGGKLKLVRPGFDLKNKHLRELGLLLLPLIGGTLFSKLRGTLETRIIAQVPAVGAASSLDYAYKLVWMPILVIPYALGIALFPFLADWAQSKDKARVTEAFVGASRLMLFIFIPMAAAFCLLDRDIITFLYASGKFDQGSVELTAIPFYFYSIGLPLYGLEIIALQVLYSHRDTTRPFITGVIASSLQILIAWLAALQFGLGAAGVALGFVCGKALKVVLLWYVLRDRITGYDWPGLRGLVAKVIVASVVMAAWIVGCKLVAPMVLDLDRPLHAMLLIGASAAGGVALYGVAATALGVPELAIVRDQIKRKLRRRG